MVAIKTDLVETIRSQRDPDKRCSAEERTLLLRLTALGDSGPSSANLTWRKFFTEVQI